MKKEKALSDGEASDFAFKKLIGDLDGIEADGLMKKDEEPASPAPGHLKIEITHQAGGAPAKVESKIPADPEEDEDDNKRGK